MLTPSDQCRIIHTSLRLRGHVYINCRQPVLVFLNAKSNCRHDKDSNVLMIITAMMLLATDSWLYPVLDLSACNGKQDFPHKQ